MRRIIRHGAFGLIVLGLGAAHADTLGELATRSRADDSASHLLLMPFVTLGLLYLNRGRERASSRAAVAAGAAVIASGAALAYAGAAYLPSSRWGNDVLTVAALALAVQWIGAFLLVYGAEATRAARFPLLFLLFIAPFPQSVLDGAVAALKAGSTEVIAVLFSLSGTPYHREGFVFSLPRVAIEISDECSGIRSSIALLLTSLLAGSLFIRSGWKRAVLVAAVLPVAILKNGIRITSLSLLAEHVNPDFLVGRLHHDGGVLFFLLALAFLAPVLEVIRRSESRRPAGVPART
jgi:exosortase